MSLNLSIKSAAKTSRIVTLASGQHYKVALGDTLRIAEQAHFKSFQKGRKLILRNVDSGEEYILDDFFAPSAQFRQTVLWRDEQNRDWALASSSASAPSETPANAPTDTPAPFIEWHEPAPMHETAAERDNQDSWASTLGLNDSGVLVFTGLGLVAIAFASTSTGGALLVPAPGIDLNAIATGVGGLVINGASANQKSAYSVSSAGDVNGDGLTDVLIGTQASTSYVVFGNADATAIAAIDLTSVAAGSGGFVINGASADSSGLVVSSAGDLNGDGYADLLISAKNANQASGRTYIVFGGPSLSQINLTDIAAGRGGLVINGIVAGDQSGASVSSAGDVNGDGLVDLLVGAPLANNAVGASYIVFGNLNNAAVNLSDVSNGRGGFVINGQTAGDQSGWSVSATGDVNGDGLADVLVGAPGAGSGAGISYVVFGKANGTAVNLSNVSNVSNGSGGFAINGQTSGDKSGWSVSAAGDVNGDGLADLLIGAPSANTAAGASYVVFGKINSTAVNLSDISNGTGGFIITGQTAGDQSGWSVSALGDFNADGLTDLLIGAPYASPSSGTSAGKSYVVFGKADTGGVNLNTVSSGLGGLLITGQKGSDMSGSAVSTAGDFNGDGLADLLVASPNASPVAGVMAGESYIILGATAFISPNRAVVQGSGNINGTSANQLILGSDMNDVLSGGGGVDNFFAGAGNDVIVLTASDVANLVTTSGAPISSVDGGGGIDTLRLNGANLDLIAIRNMAASNPNLKSRIASIERIDLASDTGANTLTLSVGDVLDMAGMNSFNTSNGWSNVGNGTALSTNVARHQLVVDGTAMDSIMGAGWTQVGQVTGNLSGSLQTYAVYNSSLGYAQLLVDTDISRSGLLP